MTDASNSVAKPTELLNAGDRLGRYQLLHRIAAGGMGVVWAARQMGQLGFRKLVAVKTVLPDRESTMDFEKLFLDEARIASLIQHPNVCGVYELGDENGTLYLAMEWIDGGTLTNVLRALPAPSRLEPRIAARIIAQAGAGLHAAHELCDESGEPLGVVHRDVSPQNILISADGHVKVADFGIVKARGQLHQKTETGEFKGKLSYLAPEFLTSKTFDRRADVFALGCVLYQATVGETPFRGGDFLATIYDIIQSKVDAPSSIVPDYPPQLEKIVLRALQPNPADRFSTCEEMRVALEVWLSESGPLVTESRVAAVMRESIGPMMDERRRAIRAAEEALGVVSGSATLAAERISIDVELNTPGGRTFNSRSRAGESGTSLPRADATLSAESPSSTSVGSFESVRVAAVRSRSAMALVAALGLAVAAGAGTLAARRGAVVQAGASPPPTNVEIAVASSRPAAVITPAGEVPREDDGAHAAPASTREISLAIRVVPKHATVLLDGRPLLNPQKASAPRDGKTHVLRVQADNYVARSMKVVFDADISTDIALASAPLHPTANAQASTVAATPTPPRAEALPQPSPVARPRRPIDQDDFLKE